MKRRASRRTTLLLAVAALAASILGCTPITAGKLDTPSKAAVLVTYDRTGGFAGFDDHLVLQEDGRASVRRRGGEGEIALDEKRLAKVRNTLDGLDFSALRDEYRGEGADLFTYTIAAKGRTITCMDSAVPPALEPVIRMLNQIVDNAAVARAWAEIVRPDGARETVPMVRTAGNAVDGTWACFYRAPLNDTASDQAYQASWNIAVTASATAAVACIPTWTTDFRDDLPEIDVPVLVMHGDADRVLPLEKTGQRLPALLKDAQLVVVEGGPHAIPWTHAAQVNTALLDFLRT